MGILRRLSALLPGWRPVAEPTTEPVLVVGAGKTPTFLVLYYPNMTRIYWPCACSGFEKGQWIPFFTSLLSGSIASIGRHSLYRHRKECKSGRPASGLEHGAALGRRIITGVIA
jgi:hypothetical protein